MRNRALNWAPHIAILRPKNPRSESSRAARLRRSRVGYRLQPARLDLEFANLVLLYLARQGGREARDKADVLGNLVVGDLALAEGANLRLGGVDSRFQARTQPPPCRHNLAQPCVGDADDLHLVHLGVGVEELLHLAG